MDLPNRHSIRLKNYDYSQNGAYFVTICTKNREELFGSVVGATRGSPDIHGGSPDTTMVLNEMGKIVENVWKSLPNHHPVELDQFQIMPNHVHMIIIIVSGGSRPAPTIGTIVGLFKSEITKQIRIIMENPEFPIFQRNYFEHIIRKEIELEKIREYITLNPQTWDRDRNNLDNQR